VLAFVSDNHGATDSDIYASDPMNHTPVARIDVEEPAITSPFPFYSDFRLSGVGSMDDDPFDALTYEWTMLRSPIGWTGEPMPCAEGEDDESRRCFTASAAGEYEIALQVSDGAVFSPRVSRVLVVDADGPPCIDLTIPAFPNPLAPPLPRDSAKEDRFEVTRVLDDADPFPRGRHDGTTSFAWFLGRGTEPMRNLNNIFSFLPIPPDFFRLGEQVRIRVEIADRNRHFIEQVLLGCKDEPLCAARPGCYQRVTWTVEYQ
jgi:hypothetical protein